MLLFHLQVQWLTGTDLMPQLLAVLEPGHSPDAAKHAAEVLAAVARSALSPLARCMAEPSFLQTLLERAFEESGPSSVQVVRLLIQGVFARMPATVVGRPVWPPSFLSAGLAALGGWHTTWGSKA